MVYSIPVKSRTSSNVSEENNPTKFLVKTMETQHSSASINFVPRRSPALQRKGSFFFHAGRMIPRALAIAAVALSIAPAAVAQNTAIQDKTLVSWVSVDDLNCRGGSALTLGTSDLWDGLVFGERFPKKWMAGSDHWRRTQSDEVIKKEEDAPLNQLTQIALVHRGNEATLLQDGKEITSWKLASEPPVYRKEAYILFGWRHLGAPALNAFFCGSIRDARIYNRPLSAEELAALKPGKIGNPQPVAWWDFEKGAQDRMGNFDVSELKGNAKIEGGQLRLHCSGDYLLCTRKQAELNRVQFRPKIGFFADPIPFFWKGRYHVFYLRGGEGKVSWYHLVSDNLVDWEQLPNPALVNDGTPDSWDGDAMFTGTVLEKDGRFYCFYTGHNGRNPLGVEGVRLATSNDLVVWTKQPDFLLLPDGKTYYDAQKRDFRDPFPYKIEGSNEWWMSLFAQSPDKKNVPAIYTSTDLQQWTPAAPLDAAAQECPDLFKIGDTYYLIGADHYSVSKDLRGTFTRPIQSDIDRPGIYAGKRMFDGKRHIWVGWIADLQNDIDGGKMKWGGTMCSPRELTPGPDGVLFVRPVQEVIDAFSKPVVDWKNAHRQFDAAQWSLSKGYMANKVTPARVTFDIPAEGMLEMTLKLSADADVTFAFRTDETGQQEGYAYTLTPSASTVVTHGQGIQWKREGCRIDTEKPVTLRAILMGQSIEFFLNDQYAFSRTAYDIAEGKLGLQISKGTVTLENLSFKQLPPKP
jgi:sucrose-6-phosphate hydrolase SacC (GH32 family)